MNIEEIKALLLASIPDAQVEVQGQGNKYHVIIATPRFEGLRPVARQQMVYAPLNAHIASGDIHAVSMQTMTPEEWRRHQLFA